MGLRKLICLLPTDETPDHDGWTEEHISEEQPGTSYSNNHDAHPYREYHRKMKTEKVNCSNGTSHLFACFRAGAINLIVHPACELACQRQGASTVQPVNSLPRTAFLERPEEHDDDDDPTSPVVTCIGQVKKEKSSKTPPRARPQQQQTRSLKSKPIAATDNVSSSRKWKQILGTRGASSINTSQQQTTNDSTEFHIDLNRFGSDCSFTIAQSTPTFGGNNHLMKFGRPDSHCNRAGSSNSNSRAGSSNSNFNSGAGSSSFPPPSRSEPNGVPLWQRRSGACKPVSLELKRRVLQRV